MWVVRIGGKFWPTRDPQFPVLLKVKNHESLKFSLGLTRTLIPLVNIKETLFFDFAFSLSIF